MRTVAFAAVSGLLLAGCQPVPMTEQEARPYRVQRGDVFIARGNGSKDLVGRAALVDTDCDWLIFPDLLIRVPVDQKGMSFRIQRESVAGIPSWATAYTVNGSSALFE